MTLTEQIEIVNKEGKLPQEYLKTLIGIEGFDDVEGYEADTPVQENEVVLKQKTLNEQMAEHYQSDFTKEELALFADIASLQNKYALINRSGTAFITYEDKEMGLQFMDISAFHTLKMDQHHYIPCESDRRKTKEVYATKSFMKHKKTLRYEGVLFDPSRSHTMYLNLWKGWTVKPIHGDITPFLELTAALCDFNQNHVDYLLDYCAHMVQKPEELPGTCIAFLGEQGTGKSMFVKTLGSFCERNFTQVTNSSMITGDFNGHLVSSFILFADEAVFAGDKIAENILKAMITEQNCLINDKYKSVLNVRNFKRLFMASNNAWAAPVSEGDRRYFVLNVNPCYKNKTGPGEFFDLYKKWELNGGREALFDYLMKRDISKFNVNGEQPKTKAWAEQMKMNFLPEIKFIYSILNSDLDLSNETLSNKGGKLIWKRNKLHRDMLEFCKIHNVKWMPSHDALGKAMQKVFKFELDNPNWSSNWKTRNDGYYYAIPDIKECQRRFAENFVKASPELIFFNYLSHDDEPTEPEDTKKKVEVKSVMTEIKKEPPLSSLEKFKSIKKAKNRHEENVAQIKKDISLQMKNSSDPQALYDNSLREEVEYRLLHGEMPPKKEIKAVAEVENVVVVDHPKIKFGVKK